MSLAFGNQPLRNNTRIASAVCANAVSNSARAAQNGEF
jgi:hypothetical protein